MDDEARSVADMWIDFVVDEVFLSSEQDRPDDREALRSALRQLAQEIIEAVRYEQPDEQAAP